MDNSNNASDNAGLTAFNSYHNTGCVALVHPVESDVDQLKSIWMNTFGDTSDYVDLLFENYFDSDCCLCAVNNGNIVASLTGIPYDFKIGCKIVKGLYLCGLSTDIAFRRRGIMRRMISEIENHCRMNGFYMTFLIPADGDLRRYYHDIGYENSALLRRSFISDEIFNMISEEMSRSVAQRSGSINTVFSGLHIMDFVGFHNVDFDEKCKIISTCRTYEYESSEMVILHSFRDWELIIMDKLSDRGLLIYDEDSGVIIIPGGECHTLYGSSESIMNMLKRIPGSESNLCCRCEDHQYGMVKILFANDCKKSEKYQGSENRIFQSDCTILSEYRKMNSDEICNENGEISDCTCAVNTSDINFRLMLD